MSMCKKVLEMQASKSHMSKEMDASAGATKNMADETTADAPVAAQDETLEYAPMTTNSSNTQSIATPDMGHPSNEAAPTAEALDNSDNTIGSPETPEQPATRISVDTAITRLCSYRNHLQRIQPGIDRLKVFINNPTAEVYEAAKGFNPLNRDLKAAERTIASYINFRAVQLDQERSEIQNVNEIMTSINDEYGELTSVVFKALHTLHNDVIKLEDRNKRDKALLRDLAMLKWADEVESWNRLYTMVWTLLGGSV